GVDPLEALLIVVRLTQKTVLRVETIQVRYQQADTLVVEVLKEVPVEALVVSPFRSLAKFAAHKEGFLPRPTPHPGKERAQLPGFVGDGMGGHLEEQRTLPVHHFIVGETQHESCGVLVNHAESKLVVVPRAVDWVLLE